MANFEKWVNTTTGNNSNAGTEAAPYLTLSHACYNWRAGLWAADDVCIVNVIAPSGIQASDRIRMWQQHNGATIIVRPASGSSFVVGDNHDYFIEQNPAVNINLEVQDCTCTRNKIIYWQGTELSGRVQNITLTNCNFTHARVNSETGIWLRETPTGTGSLTLNSCQITGWDVPIQIAQGALDSITIDEGTTIASDNLTATTGGITVLGAGSVVIQGGSSFTSSNGAVANRVDIYATTEMTVDDASFNINTTGPLGVWFRTVTGGSSTIDLSLNQLSVTATTADGGYTCQIGRDINTSLTRAANKALGANLQSAAVKNSDFVQLNVDAGTLGCIVDTDGIIVDDSNYFRTGAVGDPLTIHQIYLWGDNSKFDYNLAHGSVLLFGENQEITNNVIITGNRVLMGGTQGGSTASKGGNNYLLRRNLIVATALQAISDYAFNNAYPTNLGEFVADIDYQIYAVILDATGIAMYTPSSLVPTTIEELQNVWQHSTLNGVGSVWGADTNATNDAHSVLLSGDMLNPITSLVQTGVTLSRTDMEILRSCYLPLTNPPVIGHNGCESTINFSPVANSWPDTYSIPGADLPNYAFDGDSGDINILIDTATKEAKFTLENL